MDMKITSFIPIFVKKSHDKKLIIPVLPYLHYKVALLFVQEKVLNNVWENFLTKLQLKVQLCLILY
jgi:hypothetical protein